MHIAFQYDLSAITPLLTSIVSVNDKDQIYYPTARTIFTILAARCIYFHDRENAWRYAPGMFPDTHVWNTLEGVKLSDIPIQCQLGCFLVSSDISCDEEHSLYESNTRAYVVKIWVEETGWKSGSAIWRGHITSIPGGERKSIRSLDEITDFIEPQLEKMGARMSFSWRLRKRLKGLKNLIRRKSQSDPDQDESRVSP